MLFGFLLTLFIFVCFLLILVILVQQGKGGLGLGAIGGGAQMLFGGSGGQDLFQKITWTLGTIFMFGSFVLFVLGARYSSKSRYVAGRNMPRIPVQRKVPASKKPMPSKPISQQKAPVSKK